MKTFHLAIDCQKNFLARLQKPRDFGETLKGRIVAFADSLRLRGVPTIWIAMSYFYTRNFHHENGTPVLVIRPDSLGLPKSVDPIWDAYFNKVLPNAFAWRVCIGRKGMKQEAPALSTLLWEKDCEQVILSGLNTSLCVAESLKGSIRNGFKTIAAIDLMGDERASEKENLSPFWHKEILAPHFSGLPDNPRFLTSEEILVSLTNKKRRPEGRRFLWQKGKISRPA